MKKPLFFSLFLFAFLFAKSQVVTGVYKGKMEVDSPKYTVDFELTLKEKDGQLYGYCHRLFIVNEVLYYNLVKVTARIKDSFLIVEDEKSVSNNFEEKTKGVKTSFLFYLKDVNDSAAVLPGEWTTSRSKKFLPITGKLLVNRENNYLATQLYKRLEEKKLQKEMLFDVKQDASSTTLVKPPPILPVDTIQTITKTTTQADANPVANKPAVTTEKTKETKLTPPAIVQTTPKVDTVAKQPDAVKTNPKPVIPSANKPIVVIAKKEPPPVVKQSTVSTEIKPSLTTAPFKEKEKIQTEVNKTAGSQINTTDKPVIAAAPPPAIVNPTITKRATEIIQTVDLAEDSVVLSLYDNGEIDGDTVSVFINNEQVVTRAGLKATAYKKTVYVKRGESVQLTLFAENLGSVPPNTGLLVIYSGEQRYQIHFTSTLSKSAVIVLRRQ